jgi:hypothetical protein
LRQRLEGGLKRPPLDPRVRKRLTAVFEPDIRLLESLTGKSCRNWLD